MVGFLEVVWRPEVGTVCDQMETPPGQEDPNLGEPRVQRSAHSPPQDAFSAQ